MTREHAGRPLIRKQWGVGLEYNESWRGVCLEDAESPGRDDNVPTNANCLGKAAHGRENSFECMSKVGNHNPFDLRSGFGMVAAQGAIEIFVERDGLAELSRCGVHSRTDAAKTLVKVVDRE